MQAVPPSTHTGARDQQTFRCRHKACFRTSKDNLGCSRQPLLLKTQSLSQDSNSLDLPCLLISRSSHFNSMGTDGAASLSDVASANERPRSQARLASSRPTTESQTRALRSEHARQRNPLNLSSEPSQKHLVNTQINKTTSLRVKSGKSRLPWLDGSRSRQGSIPTVPGAFHDESPSATPSLNLNSQAKSPELQPSVTAAAPLAAELPKEPPKVEPDPKVVLQPPNKDLGIATASMPSNSTTPVNESTKVEMASDTAQPNIDNSKQQPSTTLISMARELYKTDSSAFSDSEASIKGGRQRALGDAIPLGPVKPPLAVETAKISNSSLNHDENPSPKAAVEPERISNVQNANAAEPVPPDRPISLSLQPIRCKKITMTVDDLPQQVNRNHSISVQPIKSRSNSRPMNENTPADNDTKQISKITTGLQPAAQNLHESIVDLETLMQQAVRLAEDAMQQGQSREVPAILDEARFALHRASVVQGQQERAVSGHLCYSESTITSCGSSCSSLDHSRTKVIPRRPTTIRSRATNDGPTATDQPSPGSGPKAVWDEDWPYHRLEHHPTAVDWAYSRQDLPLGVMGRDKSRQEAANGITVAHDPQTIISPTQEAFSPIQRLAPSKADVQDYIRKNNEPPYMPRSSSLANQRQHGLEGANSPELEVPTARAPAPPPSVASPPMPAESERFPTNRANSKATIQCEDTENWGRDKYDERDYVKTSDVLKGKNHITLKDGEHFSIHHGHVRQPIARNWSTSRKRFTAVIACLNTALVGVLIGIYAGEVPAIQYTLADTMHHVLLGNVCLYIGMAITTFIFWPLPLLHGRKPYTLLALGISLPLQIPQAIIVSTRRTSEVNYSGYVAGLLVSRGVLGLALGFAHINFKSTLLDLYGASLQSEFPHGETVILDDVRRHGGGMGYWLGIWSFSFIGSLALGFLVGADVISGLNISWGFYICVALIAIALFLTVITPETRRSPHRRILQEVELPNDSISRRVARGEIKMHVSGEGPKWWWEEVFAGLYLSFRMLSQSGFLVMALYLAWIYAQVVLIIVLLGNLLSVEYSWRPEYVGLGVLSIAVGALLAVPNSKANFFSRSRVHGPRTDSMTFQPRFTWTSHSVRRALFMITLPIAGLAYTFASKGSSVQYMAPIVFAGVIGYISNLAIAECNGIIMENFDTSDLQPGTNSRHRLQSLTPATKRRRTTYSSYPRVSAGYFAAQSLGFLFAAAATGVGGAVTRTVGAQKATAITAGILMGLTVLLTGVLFRFRVVQVIPNELFGSYFGSAGAERKKSAASIESDKSWRAVVIGHPSGKLRRMNWLELGSLSRWTEIRRLNRLLTRSTTQALNPGWQ